MKVVATFDKSITEVLADKVKARMNFKVSGVSFVGLDSWWADRRVFCLTDKRAIWIPTAFATKSGRS